MNSVLPVASALLRGSYEKGWAWLLIRLLSIVPVVFFCLTSYSVNAQTDFAPGEIMFTGYDSDDPDAFSIVLLTDVVSGSVIYISDRGWSNALGFRIDNTTEGVISYTFNSNYSCGTELIFIKNIAPTPDVWEAFDINSNLVGTVTWIAGDADGPELLTSGDQLFIYQLPTPTAGNQESFICMIQMNNNQVGGVDTDEESQIPSGLSDDDVVRFNTEVDNAEYDCSPNGGTATYLQTAITNDNMSGGLVADNDNNWAESNFYITLNGCSFCCGDIVLAPSLNAPYAVSTNQVFTIEITGTLTPGESWELYTSGCGSGSPLQTTMSSSFTVTAPGTEGVVTYYVRSSEDATCGTECATVEIAVCTNTNNLNTCTNCSADPQVCGDCFLPPAADNPDLDSGCYAIKLIFILDESGSIGFPVNYESDVKAGVLAFLNAINGQDMEVALIEFSDYGRLVNDYTPVNNSYIFNIEGYFDNIAYNGHWYEPGGGTNWHDAMIKADALQSADILLFFTDGIPTGWTNNGAVDYCGNGQTTQTPEIVNPVKLANKLKGEGTHMFMLGVGGGIDEENLQLMSGPIEYSAGMNTIGSADWSIGNFVDLAEDLEAFVDELCQTPLEFDKQVLGAVCNGVQQFMFIIHNPGEESAATVIEVIDTFPSGYTNIVYNGTPFIKLCIGSECDAQGQPQPPNAFIWTTNSLPPGESDTLILSVDVLPTGNYENIGWAQGSNTGLVSDTVTSDLITDDLPPTISCPGNVTIECSDSSLPPATGTATGMDPDGSDPDITYSDMIVDGSCTGEFTINRTWTATDGCTNTATCIQVIVAEDNTPPDLDCPADITIQCGDNTLPENTGDLSAVDNCDILPVVTYADVTMQVSCGSTIERTWTAEDDCGNSGTCIQVITITDSTVPMITCPSNVTVSCTESTMPANTGGSATATDNCDASPDIDYSDAISEGDCTQEYFITRTWTAVDDCGNSSTCNQVITIVDTSPPSINCPANITIECTASTLPGNTGTATATDNCNLTPTVTYSNVITSGECTQEYTITRTWSATDGCGNTTTCIQIITVEDSTAPVMSCPSNITIECTANTLPANTGSATATDNCSPSASVTFNDVTVSGSCPQEYTITRTWTATDDCGDSSTCVQIIIIDDSMAPEVTCPADITIECTASTLPANTGEATSTDNCDLSPELVYSDLTVEGSCPQEFMITRTWTTTDTCGNSSTCNQIITIVDTTVPTITCPADVTIECIENTLPDSTGTPTLLDSCDPSPEVTFSDITTSGPTPNGYTIHRTWTASDSCGNTSTCIQTIIVENPIDPGITGLAFDTICSGQTVTFIAEQQGLGGEMYEWMFGSGSSPVSDTGVGPHIVTYTYNATNGSVGASVLLTVSIAGCASVTDTVANVHVNAIPNPTINAPSTNLCYFKLRTFKPLADEMPGYTYEWTFGPGASIPSITGYGPHQVQYSTTGSKTVQLIVFSNEAGASCGDTGTLIFNVVACPGNITGKVRKPDGTGIASVNVRLFLDNDLDGLPDGPPIRSVFTTSAGVYSITNLVPGQYVVGETDPPGYFSLYDIDESDDNDTIVPSDPNDNLIPVTIQPSEIDADNVFVDVLSPGIINGYVFEDFDADGQPDPGEGIQGVTIHLHTDVDQNGVADSETPLATSVTSSVGFYTFGDIPLGDYVLTEIQPAGYDNVQDIDLTNDGDVVPNTNMMDDTIPVTLITGETDSHNFFKESSTCSHTVTNLNDDGPGSLRYAVNCSGSGDTIGFSINLANQVIHLTSDRIVIDKNIYFHSTLSPRIRIHSDIPGAFKINSGFTVEFKNMNFTSGLTGHLGAAFENYGQLILWDASIVKNFLLMPGNYLIYNGSTGFITAKGSIQVELD